VKFWIYRAYLILLLASLNGGLDPPVIFHDPSLTRGALLQKGILDPARIIDINLGRINRTEIILGDLNDMPSTAR